MPRPKMRCAGDPAKLNSPEHTWAEARPIPKPVSRRVAEMQSLLRMCGYYRRGTALESHAAPKVITARATAPSIAVRSGAALVPRSRVSGPARMPLAPRPYGPVVATGPPGRRATGDTPAAHRARELHRSA